MVNLKLIVLLSFLFINTNIILSQHTDRDLHTIYSEYLEEDRSFWVSTPQYYEHRMDRCHVLFMFDGGNIRPSETAISIRNELYENGGFIEPLIIVGINHKNRSHEMNPLNEIGPNFLKFVSEEVVSFIDSTYNTLPDRIISGHSLGGYFALHAWMNTTVFNSCFAFSPAIFNNENTITPLLKQYIKTQRPKGLVYMNNGTESETEQNIQTYIGDLTRVFKKNQNDTLLFKYREYEGYGHYFTPIVGLTDGLLFHFSKWKIDDEIIAKFLTKEVDAIPTYNRLYEELDQWAGFKVDRNNDLLNNLAVYLNGKGDVKEANNLIDYAMEIDSVDWHTLLAKGEIIGDTNKKLAKEYFVRALQYLNPKDVFENNLNFPKYEFWKEIITKNIESVKE